MLYELPFVLLEIVIVIIGALIVKLVNHLGGVDKQNSSEEDNQDDIESL